MIKYLAKVVQQKEPEEEKKEESVEIGFTGLTEPVQELQHSGSVWD